MSTNQLLGLALLGCAVVIVVAVVGTRFLTHAPPPPPPPPPPSPPEAAVTGLIRYSEGYYKASVEDAAKRWKLSPPTLGRLAEPLKYAAELQHPKQMKVEKDALDTPHLRLATHVIKEWAQTETGQRFRYEHSVLTITNKSDDHVAYRVVTEVEHPEKCASKGAIGHNAVALAPHETVERTECLWRPKSSITVKSVEVLELPLEMSYYFVSRLVPTQILLDERTAAGHEFSPGGKPIKPCAFVPWREIQVASKEHGTSWADVIDFYARHDCDEYSFWTGYQRWRSSGKLPSHSEALAKK
jgi:hypothetical protein